MLTNLPKESQDFVKQGFAKRLEEIQKTANIGNPAAYPSATGPVTAPTNPMLKTPAAPAMSGMAPVSIPGMKTGKGGAVTSGPSTGI
jgi:hypothetical protein